MNNILEIKIKGYDVGKSDTISEIFFDTDALTLQLDLKKDVFDSFDNTQKISTLGIHLNDQTNAQYKYEVPLQRNGKRDCTIEFKIARRDKPETVIYFSSITAKVAILEIYYDKNKSRLYH